MNSMIKDGTAEQIAELDTEFYELQSNDPWERYTDKYIEANPAEFSKRIDA